MSATKKAGTFAVARVTGLRWTALELVMVEVAGVEPASEGVKCPDLHA